MMTPPWNAIGRQLSAALGAGFALRDVQPVAGGCACASWRIEGGGKTFFVKTGPAERAAVFEAEIAALDVLAATGAVRVPQPLLTGADERLAWLVLEHLELRRRKPPTDARLGEALAALHRHTRSEYGWSRGSWIGSTPQDNVRDTDWTSFWRARRLEPQLRLAAERGYRDRLEPLGARLLERLPALLGDHQPPASLLHGDLWAGNAAALADGTPVLFDPALYYGDREADLAMSELFGGFASEFYAAYRTAWPLDEAGYRVRRKLYQLYHVLNHLNLFGEAYRAGAEDTIEALLAEAGG